MKVMIAGAGSVGRSIAVELTKRGHEVTIVDRNPHAMRVASVPLADWVLADACELSTLSSVLLGDCDVVVAATGDDKANLVVSLLSKTEFGVPRVVARINNPANEWLFDESWGVDVPVSTPRLMTTLIEEAVSAGEMVRRLDFHRSGASLHQATIPRKAPIVGMAISDIILPPDIVINAIVRDGVPLMADPDVSVESGDQILVLVGSNAEDHLATLEALISPASPAAPASPAVEAAPAAPAVAEATPPAAPAKPIPEPPVAPGIATAD